MGQYSRGYLESGINDIGNGVTLRSDVRDCFDRSNFVFYPLHDDADIPNISDSLSARYVAAAISDVELCYAYLLHRKEVHMHPRVSDEFLFARFAFAIISLNSSHTYFREVAVPVPVELTDDSMCFPSSQSSLLTEASSAMVEAVGSPSDTDVRDSTVDGAHCLLCS